jgi:hypothetical protein
MTEHDFLINTEHTDDEQTSQPPQQETVYSVMRQDFQAWLLDE